MKNPTILVAGVGNIFLGDDAFGSEVARKLMQREWPAAVRVEDFGIRGFDLAFALLDGPKLAVLIDALPRGGEPGTLYKFEPDLEVLDELGEQELSIETHGMNPMKVLALVKSMGGKFNRILILGCEPGKANAAEGEMQLSPPVQLAADEAVRMVHDIVRAELGQAKAVAIGS